MNGRRTVLVTGADQHQGLAVIRGIGRAGLGVIAAGAEARSLGFYSRYAGQRAQYRSPLADPVGFQEDILRIVREARPAVVIPSVETTLVLLNQVRSELERYTVLAAPPPHVLEAALDKWRTLAIAGRVGVPVPRTVRGDTTDEILARAGSLRPPFVVKPRGNALHLSTANAIGFKARYASDAQELRALIARHTGDAPALLVQEYASGIGRCVAAVCDRGTPLALFAYQREREYPRSGGVSVVRRSIPLDERLREFVTALLRETRWHGVAMVEFKYDPKTAHYTLMEINGRFQASTALSLDAGLNLPHLVASLYAGWDLPAVGPYRVGVTERWLRGDLLALRDALGARRKTDGIAVRQFFLDFRPGMHFDEFTHDDWRPGLAELWSLGVLVAGWVAEWLVDRVRWRQRVPLPAVSALVSAPAHRSIRAYTASKVSGD